MSLLALALVGMACVPSGVGAFSRSQARYLAAANHGVKQTHRWWSRGLHWYRATLTEGRVASLWQSVPLFEALSGLAIAQPSGKHLAELNRFAWGAQRYLNPNLQPVAGFGPKPGQHNPGKTTWFDDNGWWGLAFLDAYRATGNGQWLDDAEIAQNFISVSGWDTTAGRPGGIWWNTNHSFYAGESLAGGTLLSARLYAITHDSHYLDDALKYISWADVWLTDPATGLYARLRRPGTYGKNSTGNTTTTTTATAGAPIATAATAEAADRRALAANPDQAAKLQAAGGATPGPGEAQSARNNYPPFASSPMPYVNGPMILAHRIICDETGKKSFCQRAEQLAATTIAVYRRFWMGPQFDFWYARTMLEFARLDNDGDWYSIAQRSARSALHRATDRHGLYLRTWYGKKASRAGAPQGSLQLHAANAALFAWMGALGR